MAAFSRQAHAAYKAPKPPRAPCAVFSTPRSALGLRPFHHPRPVARWRWRLSTELQPHNPHPAPGTAGPDPPRRARDWPAGRPTGRSIGVLLKLQEPKPQTIRKSAAILRPFFLERAAAGKTFSGPLPPGCLSSSVHPSDAASANQASRICSHEHSSTTPACLCTHGHLSRLSRRHLPRARWPGRGPHSSSRQPSPGGQGRAPVAGLCGRAPA